MHRRARPPAVRPVRSRRPRAWRDPRVGPNGRRARLRVPLAAAPRSRVASRVAACSACGRSRKGPALTQVRLASSSASGPSSAGGAACVAGTPATAGCWPTAVASGSRSGRGRRGRDPTGPRREQQVGQQQQQEQCAHGSDSPATAIRGANVSGKGRARPLRGSGPRFRPCEPGRLLAALRHVGGISVISTSDSLSAPCASSARPAIFFIVSSRAFASSPSKSPASWHSAHSARIWPWRPHGAAMPQPAAPSAGHRHDQHPVHLHRHLLVLSARPGTSGRPKETSCSAGAVTCRRPP